ncbi:MAG: Flagellar biosynthesis protein FliS [Pseudolabrys sp.]|jgi:flagellar protein FliS|nr:Flagellar biosynthesis protein FliS [Pseudolabrys sp.]
MSDAVAYQAAQTYRSVSMAVSPLTGIVMLLDGAIASIEKLVAASEAKRFEESHNHLMKATQILRGLSQCLNFDKGGDLPDRLFRTYNALIIAALRSFGRPDAPARYGRIIASLVQLRDAWSFVRATAGQKGMRGR